MAVETQTPVYMQAPRRLRRRRRGFTRNQLNAWLDEQERLIRARGVPNELVEGFDPLYDPLPQVPENVEQGRGTFLFRFNLNLEGSIADQIHDRIVEHVKSRFMLKISTQVELRSIVDETNLDFYEKIRSSPWFETLTASRDWVQHQEELRLENQRRPNTQWAYERTLMVYVKVILDRHPLFLGLGRLPDWLRNKHGLLSLDTYRDNLCLFRCIAVHWGVPVKRNMRKTRELAEAFFSQRPGLRNRLTDKHLPLLEKHFKQGIAAYTVQPNGDFVLTHLPANYDKVGRPVLIMGLYAGHAFLIRDIKQVTRDFTCGECQARFTRAFQFASSCKQLQRRSDQNQLPQQAYPRPFISLRASLLSGQPLQFYRHQMARVGGKSAGHSHSSCSMWSWG